MPMIVSGRVAQRFIGLAKALVFERIKRSRNHNEFFLQPNLTYEETRCPLSLGEESLGNPSHNTGTEAHNKTNNQTNRRLLNEDISLPALILDNEKFHHNLNWMETFLQKYKGKLFLAPHGKTSMILEIFHQVSSKPSTWGTTLATPTHVKVAHDFGVRKVLMANQLVGKRNMELIAEILKKDESFEFICLVDSADNVEELGKFFSTKNLVLNVLLEYGWLSGRTGIRNEEQETAVLTSLSKWPETLHLLGIEFYEAVAQNEEEVKTFITFALKRTESLIRKQAFWDFENNPVIISGGGTVWFDVVAEKLCDFSDNNPTIPFKILLRPGNYMFHDVWLYTDIANRIESSKFMAGYGKLKPALKVWAYVQSIPEPNLAILGLGKRNAGNDGGYPVPALIYRPSEGLSIQGPKPTPAGWMIYRFMDQHAFMRIGEGDDLRVGDMIGLDIGHPCTTLDKWRKVIVIDNEREYNTVGVYSTFF